MTLDKISEIFKENTSPATNTETKTFRLMMDPDICRPVLIISIDAEWDLPQKSRLEIIIKDFSSKPEIWDDNMFFCGMDEDTRTVVLDGILGKGNQRASFSLSEKQAMKIRKEACEILEKLATGMKYEDFFLHNRNHSVKAIQEILPIFGWLDTAVCQQKNTGITNLSVSVHSVELQYNFRKTFPGKLIYEEEQQMKDMLEGKTFLPLEWEAENITIIDPRAVPSYPEPFTVAEITFQHADGQPDYTETMEEILKQAEKAARIGKIRL